MTIQRIGMENILYYFTKACLVLIFSLFSPITAVAHGDMDKIFDSIEAPHGGRIRESGGYQLELVVNQKLINVYVTRTNNAAPIDLTAASAAVIIVNVGKKEVLDLEYKDGSFFTMSQFDSLDLSTIALVVTLGDGSRISAKFLPRNAHH